MHARLRRLLTAALVMSALAVLGAAIAVTVALNTNWGRELTTRRVRAMLTQQLAPGTQVEMHGLFLTPLGTVRLDSLVLRDSAGATMGALRGLRVAIDIRAAFNREVHFTSVAIARLDLDLIQDVTGRWNYASVVRTVDTSVVDGSARVAPWRIRIDTLSWLEGSIAVMWPQASRWRWARPYSRPMARAGPFSLHARRAT